MALRMLPLLLLAAAPLGCATISRGEASSTDDKVLRIERSIQQSNDVEAEVEQSENMLHLRARWRCDVMEVRKIRRTTTYPKHNEALAPEMVLLTLGAIPAGFGIGMIVDSKNVYEHDRNSRLYNAAGPTAAIGGGIALLAVGAALMAVPVVDGFRSIGSEEDEQEVSENGAPIQRDVPCNELKPAAYQTVLLTAPGTSFSVGSTDASGNLNVDLSNAIPAPESIGRALPDRMSLQIAGHPIGVVSLATPLAVRRARQNQGEDALWQSIDISACRTRQDPTACQQIKSYLMRFPDGAHARDALRILDPSQAGGAQIAASPEDIAKQEAAQKAAAEALEKAKKAAQEALEAQQKAAQEACRKKCESSCKKDAACSKSCVEEVCQ